ncbi:hypothetical protein MKX01_013938 [Papaver californicum]|nr:hypothetical protein MKX01_013938 [Papaver californicum]
MKTLLNFLEFSSNLELLVIKKELEMVKFVVKHARVLQTVILETSYTKKKNLKAKDVEALNKKIMTQLRMSAGCFIKFSSS